MVETYSVSQNNWLNKVKNVVKAEGLVDGQTKAFVPIWPKPDPAYGCPKEFTSAYKCAPGTTQKQISIPASADGHVATYDCSQEFIQCASGVLEIQDNGEVILRNSDGSKIYWRSGAQKTGLAIDTFSAAKSKYKRNYLQAGETLGVGEWVGSPSGNCYLTVVSDGSTSKLVVAFQEIACTPPSKDGFPAPPVCNTEYKSLPNKNIASVLIGGGGPENRYNYDNLEAAQQQCNAMDNCSGITRDGYGYNLRSGGPSPWPGMSSWQKEKVCTAPPGPSPEGLGKDGYITSESKMGAWYNMSQGVASNEYAGKVAYSDTNMHRREYPSNMVHKGNDFIKIAGNFNQKDGIAKTMAGDFDTCKTECNNMGHCEGIITSKDNTGAATCSILSSAFPNKNRILDVTGTDTLYVRKAQVDNPPTCSSEVESSYGATFANQIAGLEMTPKTKCSLGQMTAEQMKLVNAAQAKLQNAANKVAGDLSNLNQQNATLDQDMLDQIAQVQKETVQYGKVQKKTNLLEKELGDVSGMEESSGFDMVSNNMQLVMWTALGAIAVIGTIKATK